MLKTIIACIALILLAASSFAQSQQATVEMDATAFIRDSGKVQVEIYYSIVQGALQFEQKGTTWIAPINARIEIRHDGHVVTAQEIKKEKTVKGSKASLDSGASSLILDGAALKGNFVSNDTASLIIISKNNKGAEIRDTISRKFYVPTIEKDKFFMSGVELANSLQPTTDRANPFEKVGYIVTPNPSKLYNSSNSKLSYYTELYVPPANVSSSAAVEIITKVLDGQKHEMFSNSHSQFLAAATIPLVGSIDIDGLPTDSYILEVVIKLGGTVVATIQKGFFYDSGMKLSEDQADPATSAVVDEEAIFLSSDLSRMSEFELLEKGEQAMYIGKTDQVKAWKKMKTKLETDEDNEKSASSDTGKSNAKKQVEDDISKERRFLFSFWRAKDKELGARMPLQSYNIYYKNVDDVNKKFTHQKTPGWETDFGRIYLSFGAPDERNIRVELHNIDSKPFIIWQYITDKIHLISTERSSSEPGSLSINYNYPTFIFVDRQGGGKFVLVHSNVQGEVFEQDWYTQDALRTH